MDYLFLIIIHPLPKHNYKKIAINKERERFYYKQKKRNIKQTSHFDRSHHSAVFIDTIMNLNESEDAYNKVNVDEPHHKKSWTHELVAGAAGFAGTSHL